MYTKKENGDKKGSAKPAWMNSASLKAMKSKRNAWNKYMFTRHPIQYKKFSKARNDAIKETRKARRNCETKLAADIEENHKAFWKHVKDQEQRLE